jgi:hypothetical protein
MDTDMVLSFNYLYPNSRHISYSLIYIYIMTKFMLFIIIINKYYELWYFLIIFIYFLINIRSDSYPYPYPSNIRSVSVSVSEKIKRDMDMV